mmetsp:Transcript_17962/g.25389  ORF Transcript_17962/g.25389 Transcript_17962/m.25389 type:complete len:89 (+) Transcript_17962:3-269(+)
MQRAVTDHLPKNAWKRLDEPSMIDRPDLDTYVFCRVLEPIQIDNFKDLDMGDNDFEEDLQHVKTGSTMFLRYAIIQDLLLEGKVSLLI